MDSKAAIAAHDAPDQVLDELQVDRSSFSVARLADPDDSPAYWLSRPVDIRRKRFIFIKSGSLPKATFLRLVPQIRPHLLVVFQHERLGTQLPLS
jgi:hypothetical protein